MNATDTDTDNREPVLLADAVDTVLEWARSAAAHQNAQDRSGRVEGTEDGETVSERVEAIAGAASGQPGRAATSGIAHPEAGVRFAARRPSTSEARARSAVSAPERRELP